MALKQVNWGFLFKRNAKGPLDPDIVFDTCDEMESNAGIYNGAIVCVTNDALTSRNGIYWAKENDSVSGTYLFNKVSLSSGTVGIPFFICDSAEVVSIEQHDEDNTYEIKLTYNPFLAFDIIGWNISDDLTSGTYSIIQYIVDDCIYISTVNNIPNEGNTIYHVGNSVDNSRSSFYAFYLKNNKPYQCVFVNKSTQNINKKLYIYISNDSSGNPILHSENSYLIGTFIDTNGKNLSDEITTARALLDSGLQELRDEFNSNNIIYNPFFLSNLSGWESSNEALFYFSNGKWVITTNGTTQDGLYSAKRKGSYRGVYDNKTVVSIQQGSIIQSNDTFMMSGIDKTYDKLYFSVILMYHAITDGTMSVKLGSNDAYVINMNKTTGDWIQLKYDFLWDYTGDLIISYTRSLTDTDLIYAEVKIKSIQVVPNDIATLKYKYSALLSHADTLVNMALEKELESQS